MTPEEKRIREHAADARYRKKMKLLGRKRDRTEYHREYARKRNRAEYNREYARKRRAKIKALKQEQPG